MTYEAIRQAAQSFHLTPLGGFQSDGYTTVLLAPLEPGFWSHVSQDPQFSGSDPLDRWSAWAVTEIAAQMGARAVFPFGGPPFQPFISWALQSGACWQSPVGLLVHKQAGLLVSYRGALIFDLLVDLPEPSASPCDTCDDKPCLTACPVGALGANGYDVPRCKDHIPSDPVCAAGCRVRLSCPVSQSYPRAAEQTAFHMAAFMGTR